MNARELRQEAREALRGKWQKAILISIIYAAILLVLSILVNKVHSIFSIIEIVIAPALTYGIAHSYYHLKKGDEVGYVDFLTVGFKNFGRSWKITWEVIKKMWWCILIAIIPLAIMIVLIGGAIVASFGSSGILSSKSYKSGYYYDTASPRTSYSYNYGSTYPSSYTDEEAKLVASALQGVSAGAIIGAVIALIVYIAIMVFVTIRGLLYVLAYYIAAIKEDADPKDAVAESETLMKGNRGRYFCLMLSFFGWYFLAGFVSGIFSGLGLETISTILAQVGTAIIAPYTTFAVLAFYKNIAKERNVSIPDSEPVASVASEENETTNQQ